MPEKAILFISPELGLAAPIVHALERTVGACVRSVTTVGQAIAVGGLEDYSLILLSLSGADDLDRVDGLLWSCSTARRPVPVVAVADRYDEAEALTLFRMGVADYLSLSDHRDAIPAVVGYLVSAPSAPWENGTSEGSPRSWTAPRELAVSQSS